MDVYIPTKKLLSFFFFLSPSRNKCTFMTFTWGKLVKSKCSPQKHNSDFCFDDVRANSVLSRHSSQKYLQDTTNIILYLLYIMYAWHFRRLNFKTTFFFKFFYRFVNHRNICNTFFCSPVLWPRESKFLVRFQYAVCALGQA